MENFGTLKSVLLVGCGATARAVIPILVNKLPSDIALLAVDAEASDAALFASFGSRITFYRQTLTPQNFASFLEPLLTEHSFVLNLSTGISSVDMIRLCQKVGALYLDTCSEPWAGGYAGESDSDMCVTNGFLRQQALDLRREFPHGATAVLAHGANPGLISHFVKDAILLLAQADDRHCADMTSAQGDTPTTRSDWIRRARALDICAIQIAERDTQRTEKAFSAHDFFNTWSADGFLSELMQPSEFGIGTHEKRILPVIERASKGPGAYFPAPSVCVRVKTWTPDGPGEGYLVTHNESLSIADYFSHSEGSTLTYRPTVYYAYQPCEIAQQSIKQWQRSRMTYPENCYVLKPEDIVSGTDYLGVLLITRSGKKFWYGSRLDIDCARRTAPFCSATTLQVAAGIYSGMRWALANPNKGIVEADEMDHREVMDFARPFLGDMIGLPTDWSPIGASSAGSNTVLQNDTCELTDYLVPST